VKAVEAWHSDRIEQEMRLVRWGAVGVPVLLFPTAGGDAEEAERFGLIDSIAPLMAAGRIKVYSVDSVAGRSWTRKDDPRHSMWLQNQFDAVIREEVVPAIRADCRDDSTEIVTAGASIGAFWALEVICRHADVFRLAICMSGSYDLSDRLHGHWNDDFYFSSPLHYLPDLDDGWELDMLRSRFVVLACGQGRWEDPGESWRVAHVLGERGIPNRVDLWSHDHDHDWPTWREMLPLYLDDMA
jgi:esterase/lipase superfamily enzyme